MFFGNATDPCHYNLPIRLEQNHLIFAQHVGNCPNCNPEPHASVLCPKSWGKTELEILDVNSTGILLTVGPPLDTIVILDLEDWQAVIRAGRINPLPTITWKTSWEITAGCFITPFDFSQGNHRSVRTGPTRSPLMYQIAIGCTIQSDLLSGTNLLYCLFLKAVTDVENSTTPEEQGLILLSRETSDIILIRFYESFLFWVTSQGSIKIYDTVRDQKIAAISFSSRIRQCWIFHIEKDRFVAITDSCNLKVIPSSHYQMIISSYFEYFPQNSIAKSAWFSETVNPTNQRY